MAEQRSTPEEKLLKLIEKEDSNEPVTYRRKRNIFLGFSGFWFSFKSTLIQGVAKLKGGAKEPNLKVLNKLLFAISILLLGYSITGLVFGRPSIEEVYNRSKRTYEDNTESGLALETRPFLHYLEMAQRRNIFSPITLKEVEEPEVQEEKLQEMASDLGLVGISLDNEPMAMIEDKKLNKTHFLRQGDRINEFKIEKILENKVILSFEDKEVELM